MKRYTIGLDYGSLSARAVLMDLETGAIAASRVWEYPHGVMSRQLPDGTPLGHDWAIQDPEDYWDALHRLIPPLLADSGIQPEQVAALGLDVTACTILPTDAFGTPLCRLPGFSGRPHAWLKLWKHHAAQPQADRLQELAREQKAPWLAQFGGGVSCEHYFPKAAQIAQEDPELFSAAHRLIEAGDWLTWRLCGQESRGYCAAAFKTFYRPEEGGVDPAFLAQLHPLLAQLPRKLPDRILAPGEPAGTLTDEAARWVGLLPGTPVAAAMVDAHVTLIGCHMSHPGQLLLIIGTSTCAIVQSPVFCPVEGISGVVPGGILPGLNAYEGGQSSVGDLFDWFVRRCVPPEYHREAELQGISLHRLLAEKADALAPGQSGLVALDWWNGARSVLMDSDLSGLLVGMTLDTRPEEIYRALLEATAFGARRIIQAIEDSGVPIRALCVSGGIPKKNRLLCQIYADVCGRDVFLMEQEQSGALGSAVLAAAAAMDGADSLSPLMERYRLPCETVFSPDPAHVRVYDELYRIYGALHDLFGRDSSLMHTLKKLKTQTGNP